MNKVILSSNYFLKVVNALQFKNDEFFLISVKGRVMSILGKDIQVEHKTDFTVQVEGATLKRLASVFRVIQDQPVVLCFDSSYRIEVLCITV